VTRHLRTYGENGENMSFMTTFLKSGKG
jgi:hypothetical protein